MRYLFVGIGTWHEGTPTLTDETTPEGAQQPANRGEAGSRYVTVVPTEEEANESKPPKRRKPRQPGSAKDKILYMADDFDAPLEDFGEYME